MKIKTFKNVIDKNFTLILTSNSNEKNLINNLFECSTKININSKIIGKIGLIKNKIVLHISGGLGISANDAIGKNAILFLNSDEFPKPKLTILAGVCWGNPKITAIGDVLISNSILSTNLKNSNKIPDNISPITSSFTFDYQDENTFKTFNNVLILSDENRIEDSDFRNSILDIFPNIHGGEMEGFSFLNQNFNWLVVKVVADHGEKLKKSDQQKTIGNIKPIINSIIEKTDEETSSNIKFIELKDYLKSLSVKIEIPDNDSGNKKIIITNKYLSLIDSNLLNYHSENSSFNTFKFSLRSLILEILYNSFIHGKASSVDIKFNKNFIQIIENGIKFNLETLSSIQKSGGGSSIFSTLKEHVLIQNYEYTPTKKYNMHTFKFSDQIRNIKEIKLKCEFHEDEFMTNDSIHEFLDLDQTCSAFYLDARKLPTQSFNPFILDSCLTLINKTEKHVFLKLDGEPHKEMLIGWPGFEKYHTIMDKIIFLT